MGMVKCSLLRLGLIFPILFEQATSETEGKIQALVDLGFDRAAAENALLLCNGNQDQAASYLFGGYD
jgi:DNA damage-inducible protein 1